MVNLGAQLLYIGRKAAAGVLLAAAALWLAACTPYYEDFMGTWVGIDESNPQDIVLYEYEIVSAGGQDYAIRLTRSSYVINDDFGAVWTTSQPRFLLARYNPDDGSVTAPFGTLTYSTKSGNVVFGNINFVRKAKNTELKLKYVARRAVEKYYPDVPITD